MSWKHHVLTGVASLIVGAATVLPAFAQTVVPQTVVPPTAVPQAAEDALRMMTDAAGVVFTGTVTAVRRSAGVVEIDFAVADAIRGVSGSSFTLREWAGLWEASDEPFRPGQRYLMLLHTPNSAGLTSPVDGPDGAIPIRSTGTGAVTGTGTEVAAAGASAYDSVIATVQGGSEDTVDLGWVATHVAVPVTYRASTPARPILASGVQADSEVSNSAAPLAAAPRVPSPLRAPKYSSVVKMLRAWGTPDEL